MSKIKLVTVGNKTYLGKLEEKQGGKVVIKGAVETAAVDFSLFLTKRYLGESYTVTLSGEVYSSRNLTPVEQTELKGLKANLDVAIKLAPRRGVVELFKSGK